MKFMLITNDPNLAMHAELSGIRRIFVDLEHLGKQERQGHLDTFISGHVMSDVAKVKGVLSTAELLVRLNPLNANSESEIDQAIAAGADLLMLPMFYQMEEVQRFAEYVNGRVGFIPLVETLSASKCLKEVVTIKGVTEVYIGLNDLHLDMQLDFMFEPLANGLIDEMAEIIRAVGLPFGFGGVARVGEGVIPGELVMGEHQRLESSSVILSRTFHRSGSDNPQANIDEMKRELAKLIDVRGMLENRTEADILNDHKVFQAKIKKIAAEYKK